MRSLQHFAPDISFDLSHSEFSFDVTDGLAVISFKELPDRQVTGLLSLPQFEVSIDFSDVSPSAQQSFVDRFDLAFRRGGG